MNVSEESRRFLTTCKACESSYVVLRQFPSEEYKHNRIALLVVNCMLVFSTILLNGISVITIRKSYQLRNNICCFVILLQSIFDLVVGALGIPLFIYYLLYPFLNTSEVFQKENSRETKCKVLLSCRGLFCNFTVSFAAVCSSL